MEAEAGCSTRQSGLFEQSGQVSSYSRMSKECSQAIEDSTSPPFFVKWPKAGLVRRSDGEFLTANISERHRDAVESSLSQVLLEDAPRKYWLSTKAATGILIRASRKGRKIPQVLRDALLVAASLGLREQSTQRATTMDDQT